MKVTDFRLKIRHFFRKYKKLIFVVVAIWGLIFLVNYLLRNKTIKLEPSTTYEPHVSVMDSSSSTPSSLQKPIETMLEEYIETCNDGNYQKAFDMLSEECKKFEFNNDVEKFMKHVLVKMPTPKEYTIQNYSNVTVPLGKLYIYEVKYTDDVLATGLTNAQYSYTSEKIAFYLDKDNNVKMSVGNYIYHSDIQSIAENEYLKIDVIDKKVNYSTETYEIKFTNRSEYTIVIADGYGENEVTLELPQETRKRDDTSSIVLGKGESQTLNISFPKFVDDGDTSQNISFGSIRVMENYSGTEVEEEIIKNEITNALAKFSMNISVLK